MRTCRPRLVITGAEASVGGVSEPVTPATRRGGGTRLIAAGIVALLIAAAVSALVLREPAPRVTGLAPTTPSPFGDDGELVAGPSEAWYSPEGTRLAVLSEGALALALEGELERLTERGGNVVDAAWFGAGTALLVAEGPAPTGGLAVVERSGKVRGTIPLDPVVTFGDGLGMSISPGGKRAIVTTVERDPFGARLTRLVGVDLTTGAAAPIETGPGDARGPHHLTANVVAFTRVQGEQTEAVVFDLSTGREVVLGPGQVRGVIGAGEIVAVEDATSLIGYRPGGERSGVLAQSLRGPVVAVHPSGATAVVAVLRGDATVLTQIPLAGEGST